MAVEDYRGLAACCKCHEAATSVVYVDGVPRNTYCEVHVNGYIINTVTKDA